MTDNIRCSDGKALYKVDLPSGFYNGYWMENFLYIEEDEGQTGVEFVVMTDSITGYKTPVEVFVHKNGRAEFWKKTDES